MISPERHEELEALFSRSASTIDFFCRKYNLLLQKYERESETWSLSFRIDHVRHLYGKVEVRPLRNDNVNVSTLVFEDDYQRGVRYLETLTSLDGDLDSLADMLNNSMEKVKSWDSFGVSSSSHSFNPLPSSSNGYDWPIASFR